jgi:hypothetical protein
VSEAKVYGSLEELVKSEAVVMADPEQGPRVYQVGKQYVTAASPGQAALACSKVELVPRRKLLKAAFYALSKVDAVETAKEV